MFFICCYGCRNLEVILGILFDNKNNGLGPKEG